MNQRESALMSMTIQTIRRTCAVVLTGVALVMTGCADATTQEDVAGAREELREEEADVAEAQDEAQQEIAEAEAEAQEHTVGKPVTEDDAAAEAQQDVAEARQDAAADIAEEKADVAHAEAELKTEEQRLQATQERDAYVKEVEGQLASIEKDIDGLEEQASNAEGADKDAINLKIENLNAQHDRIEEALSDLKSADLASWKNHQQHVRTAMQNLENVR
jgi:DNA repair exonuclease SbcCD ATPase subunit